MSIFSKLSKAAYRAAGGFAAEPYDPATQIPVIRSSICTGEKVAGFKDKRSGRFTVEPGRLHISASTTEEPRENDYESFVVEGDTLTITDYAGTSALDLVYPLVFQRVS